MNDPRAAAAQAWCETQLGLALSLEPATADASSRRYFRVVTDGGRYIVMDAPAQAASVAAFTRVAAMMRTAGLHVPQVLSADYRNGFLLLTDLGRHTYLDKLSGNPAQRRDAEELFQSALESLVRWQAASRPTRLAEYTPRLLRAELQLFVDWYLVRHCGLSLGRRDHRRLDALFERMIEKVGGQGRVYVHRDFMPRNLLCAAPLPGVIDFQDAVRGPVAYDPICLFRDAFISWPRAFVVAGLHDYWERARSCAIPVAAEFDTFWRDCQWIGVQRHLKVLGVFARLHYRAGKPHYLNDAPRFFGYLRAAACEEPELAPLIRPIVELSGESIA